jgi:hypothetical protein
MFFIIIKVRKMFDFDLLINALLAQIATIITNEITAGLGDWKSRRADIPSDNVPSPILFLPVVRTERFEIN